MNMVGLNVIVEFFDDTEITGFLGYTKEFSEKYDYRKKNCFTIDKYDFRASHVKKIRIIF